VGTLESLYASSPNVINMYPVGKWFLVPSDWSESCCLHSNIPQQPINQSLMRLRDLTNEAQVGHLATTNHLQFHCGTKERDWGTFVIAQSLVKAIQHLKGHDLRPLRASPGMDLRDNIQ
jgi:hypothetical protein